MDAVEYRNKKDEVLSKFRKEFWEGNYLYDAELHAIVEMLIRGQDPYIIIEDMVKRRQETDKKLQEYVLLHAQPPLMHICCACHSKLKETKDH